MGVWPAQGCHNDHCTTLWVGNPHSQPPGFRVSTVCLLSHFFFFKHLVQVQGGARHRSCTANPSHSPARVRKGRAASPPKVLWHEAHRATVPLRARRRLRTRCEAGTPPWLRIWLGFGPLPYAQRISEATTKRKPKQNTPIFDTLD